MQNTFAGAPQRDCHNRLINSLNNPRNGNVKISKHLFFEANLKIQINTERNGD